MWTGRKLDRIEHLILAALLASGLSATAVEAKKRSQSKDSKSEPAESAGSKTTSTSGSTAAAASTPAATATATVTLTPAASPTAASATTSTSAKTGANTGTASTGASTSTPSASPSSGTSPDSAAPGVDSSQQGQVCYVPRKVMAFREEALIVPGPATQRWNAGRVLYGVGTGLSMGAASLSSIGGIFVAAGASTASLSDPGPALSLAGTIGNITGTALLVSGLAAQHSALGMIGKDSGRTKFITGVVFGALGLASMGTGYILGGLDIPNKDILNYAIGYGGTLLLTTASSILISDARKLRQIWDTLGMRPGVPTYPMQPRQQPVPYPQQQPVPYPQQQPYPYPQQQPYPYPQQQPVPYPQQPYPYPQQQPVPYPQQ